MRKVLGLRYVYGSGSLSQQEKKVKQNLDIYRLWLLNNLL